MSVSSISQTVSKLEDELQVKLLNRSTRSIGLTEAGKIYYQGCRRMLQEVQDVHEQLYAFNNTPIGTLRIGCSSTMAQNVLAAMTADMLKEYRDYRQSGDGYPGAGSDRRRAGRGDPRRRVAGFQPVLAGWAACRWWSAPQKAIWRSSSNPPISATTRGWSTASRPDNEFELIAPEGISTKLLPAEGGHQRSDDHSRLVVPVPGSPTCR
jgi:hypothetical protein